MSSRIGIGMGLLAVFGAVVIGLASAGDSASADDGRRCDGLRSMPSCRYEWSGANEFGSRPDSDRFFNKSERFHDIRRVFGGNGPGSLPGSPGEEDDGEIRLTFNGIDIIIINNSDSPIDFCVFQPGPSGGRTCLD